MTGPEKDQVLAGYGGKLILNGIVPLSMVNEFQFAGCGKIGIYIMTGGIEYSYSSPIQVFCVFQIKGFYKLEIVLCFSEMPVFVRHLKLPLVDYFVARKNELLPGVPGYHLGQVFNFKFLKWKAEFISEAPADIIKIHVQIMTYRVRHNKDSFVPGVYSDSFDLGNFFR